MRFSGLRFLLVEDEPVIGFALEDMVIEEGGKTAFASTEETALELLDQQEFDCAILDVNLHGRESYPVARKIVERNIRLIFATGYGSQTHPAEFRDIPTVSKPYSIDSLAEALDRSK